MDPRFGVFLQQVLGYTLNVDLRTQDTARTTGDRPDYIPDDTLLHSFVFDAKGSNTRDLGDHYDQIARYIRDKGLRYGVLSNMRDLATFTASSRTPEREYSFSFQRLYHDYKTNRDAILFKENTTRFLAFCDAFEHRSLDSVGKIAAIIGARHGPRDARLDLNELVRYLREIVERLHADVRVHRPRLIKVVGSRERKRRIALEIDELARESEPSTPEREVSDVDLPALLEASDGTTDGQAADRYFYQVAYFAMTRILLARTWEDIEFIDQVLYNGGFEQWYERTRRNIREVLDQSFHYARERYTWLYGAQNNYTWYVPSEDALVDVLYDLSRFDFRLLDADVLGAVYEAYLDRTDRKNKGQYYTPRPIVRFIWDQVGFTTQEHIFRIEGGRRSPRIILDFCTGSGGFDVEAARRIRAAVLGPDVDYRDPARLRAASLDDLELAMAAIVEGVRGCEINPFAYYLTEVNLLIQLTPIIAAIRAKDPDAPALDGERTLSVIHQDALKLHQTAQLSFGSVGSDEFAQHHEVYEQDERRDITNLEGPKREVYQTIKGEDDADYVCSNPPMLARKGTKTSFATCRNICRIGSNTTRERWITSIGSSSWA